MLFLENRNYYCTGTGRQTLNLHNSALIRPLEELLHYKCSTLRGELDSSTPRVLRGFWSQVCLGRSLPRKSPKSVKIGKNRKIEGPGKGLVRGAENVSKGIGLQNRHVFAISSKCSWQAAGSAGRAGRARAGRAWAAPSSYPVVVITWVQYLVPPGPFSFPDSRDLLEVLRDFLGRERGWGP